MRQMSSLGLWSHPAGSHLLTPVPSKGTQLLFSHFTSSSVENSSSELGCLTLFPISHLQVKKPQISKLKGSKFSLSASNYHPPHHLSSKLLGSLNPYRLSQVNFHTKQKKLQTYWGDFGLQLICQLHV